MPLVGAVGFPAGSTDDALTTNADLAPTIADVAGAQPGLREDGVSLVHTIPPTRIQIAPP